MPRPPRGPQGPSGPKGPSGPDQPKKRSSRFGKRSKTKNIKCSEAASAWQLAIRRGGSPGAEVYKTLAHCRAANKTAKAALATGTAAGAGLAQRAVTSRVDRSLATATSRKAELKTRLQERARRTISDADRQRANDIASRVTGNDGGPSAALKRLQGVRAPRTRRSTSPAATVPPASQAATPAASTPRTPIRAARSPELVARRNVVAEGLRRAYREGQANPLADTSGAGGYRARVRAAEQRHRDRMGGTTGQDRLALDDAGRVWLRSMEARAAGARVAANRGPLLPESDRTRINKNRGRDAAGNQMPSATPAASTPRTRRAAAPTPPLRTESGIRSEAAALFRNMRATGRGQQARDLSGMARMKIVARDGLSRNLNNSLRRASPLEILNQASRQGIGKQPIIQGPKPPRIGLDAYHAARSARTQPGVAESRSAAARGLRALRQAGDMGRAEASALRAGATGSSTTERGQNMVDRIISNRQIRGRSFHRRGISANNKGYEVGSGTFAATTTRAERRSAAATELAGASFKRPPGEAGGGKIDLAKYRRK